MLREITKSVIDLIVVSPEEKDRVQEQLKTVLDGRFNPCIELWRELWQFGYAEDLKGEDGSSNDDTTRLSKTVDEFMHQWGALISIECLAALSRFQEDLREVRDTKDELYKSVALGHLKKQLVPWSEKVDGNGVNHPGLLLLLRDQLGSNSRAASIALK
jgi:hypothetical protein